MDKELWAILEKLKSDNYDWVDLSYDVSLKTHHWEGYNDLEMYEILTFEEHNVSAREYKMVSQYGTHIDPPSHFIQGGRTLDQLDVKEMIYPLCVIDVSDKVTKNADYAMTVADIKAWEAEHGSVPEGCFVAMRTDWYKREGEAYFNRDAQGNCHYPGWSLEALEYLCEIRNVAAIGHEPPDTDPAVNNKTALWAGELYYLSKDKYQIELLRNLDKLPPVGAIIFCTFPKVIDAPGFTARCFSITPK